MKNSPISTGKGMNRSLSDTTNTRFHRRWLRLSQALWLVLAGCASVVFLIALPERFIQLTHPPSVVQMNLAALGFPIGFYAGYNLLLEVAFTGSCLVLALFLFWRKSDEFMALFVALFLVAFGVTMPPTVSALGNNAVWQVAITSLNALGWASLSLFFLLFPNGRFVPWWTRWLTPWFLFYVLLWHLPRALPLHPSHWPLPFVAFAEISALSLLASVGVYRYRKASDPPQRQQIKWVVTLGAGGMGSYLVANILLPELFPIFTQTGSAYDLFLNPLLSCGILLIPVSLTIAILRYRLWDIDLIINRTLVYVALTACVLGIYVLVVGGLGTLLQMRGNLVISLLATGLIAILFQPLRQHLQQAVNRLMFGERDDPYRVLSLLGQRLEAVLAPEEVLPTFVEMVAQTLKLPFVAITLEQGEELISLASHGTVQEEVLRLPLVYQAEQVGELLLAPRAPGEAFTPADHRLLEDLARQAGVATHAVRLTEDLKRLTADLQRSRERLVTAREEERRRLRRDLHDGLGPQLASLTLKLETARNRLAHDALADTLLTDLTARTQAAVTDIRRLVYALRPPALDELGLVAALREQTLQYTDLRQPGLSIRLDSPDDLPELPAAVEVAAYRIAQEALTNVVRHAQACSCTLRLALDHATEMLTVEVRDDGRGWSLDRKHGVGLISMRERAEELGGRLVIEPVPGGGLAVRAQLPCARLSLSHDEPGHLPGQTDRRREHGLHSHPYR